MTQYRVDPKNKFKASGCPILEVLKLFFGAPLHRKRQRTAGLSKCLTNDINAGKLDYFYFLIARTGSVNFIYFLFAASRYQYMASGKVEAELTMQIRNDADDRDSIKH
ncbi:hypothetical protein Ddye_031080 [Dipteronia dyeriana]|uniref:Uncharacterized protein n=1 Tax=Dipteronia dyeriana TaxID=168575 RepID=A0AAD9WNB3_9ROSI|nr:hypothetical protein Ddye_031080 [Dipteronia dyeriana]